MFGKRFDNYVRSVSLLLSWIRMLCFCILVPLGVPLHKRSIERTKSIVCWLLLLLLFLNFSYYLMALNPLNIVLSQYFGSTFS